MAFTAVYLSNDTAPYVPSTIRGAYDDTSGGVTRALTPSLPIGSELVATTSVSESSSSDTYDVLLYRGVSGPIASQTISGTVDLVIAVCESNADADLCYHVHIYATQGDSDTPRGTLLADYVESTANEWTAASNPSGRAFASSQTLSSLAVSDGDRLVVEIGYIARNTESSSRSGTIAYGRHAHTLNDLAAGEAYTLGHGLIVFSQSITEPALAVRATQTAVDAFVQPDPSARVSQVAIDAIVQLTPPLTRVSQIGVEVFVSNVGAGSYLFPPLTVAA